jgi:hypothetical protein
MPKLGRGKVNSFMSSKKDLIDYLDHLRSNFLQYHARKESLTWLATSVYLGGILALGSLFFDQGRFISLNQSYKCGLIIFLWITYLLVYLFTDKQFSDRTYAAHIIASCNEALAQLLDDNFQLERNLLLAKDYTEAGHESVFPQMLVNRLTMANKRHRPLWNYASPFLVTLVWTAALTVLILTS